MINGSNMGDEGESIGYIVSMVLCAIVSFVTCLVGFKVFPTIVQVVNLFELSASGRIIHADNYLVKAVELCEN
eukprot:gene16984-23328_t